MKMGYRLVIEDGLSSAQRGGAEAYADWLIAYISDHKDSWKGLSRGGRATGMAFRRGVYGESCHSYLSKNDLVFRRMSRGRRIFGIIRPEHLVDRKGNIGKDIVKGKCKCHGCSGGTKVSLLTQPKVSIYYQTGVIKG